MMKGALLLLLASLSGGAGLLHSREHYERAFIDWTYKYNMSFESGAEFVKRLDIFAGHSDMIEKHNAGNHSWTMGHNRFSHLSWEEFVDGYLGRLRFPEDMGLEYYVPPTGFETPSTVDWETKGAVTPVKDQQMCGSCWAFSATGAMEGAYYLKTGELVSFSEQQIVDCADSYGNYGCSGGWPYRAVTYVHYAGGLSSEELYPYLGIDAICHSFDPVPGSKPFGYVQIDSERDLETAAAHQPVSVCIDVEYSFQLYASGVYNSTCGTSLNHAVLVVGYGVSNEDSLPYWRVKNSWGTSWGEEGYIRMLKGANQCGIASAAMIPLV